MRVVPRSDGPFPPSPRMRRFLRGAGRFALPLALALGFLFTTIIGIVLTTVVFSPRAGGERWVAGLAAVFFYGASVWLAKAYQRRRGPTMRRCIRTNFAFNRWWFRWAPLAAVPIYGVHIFQLAAGSFQDRLTVMMMLVVTIYCGMMLFSAIHESGYVLAAGFLGWKLERFQIGRGASLWRHQTRSGFIFEWRLNPISGYTAALRPNDVVKPAHERLYVAGGLLAGLAALTVVLLFMRPPKNRENFTLDGAFDRGIAIVFFAGTMITLNGLNPRAEQTDREFLLRNWQKPSEKVDRQLDRQLQVIVSRLDYFRREKRRECAWNSLATALSRHPEYSGILSLIAAEWHLEAGNYHEANAAIETALTHSLHEHQRDLARTLHIVALVGLGQAERAGAEANTMAAESPLKNALVNACACLPQLFEKTLLPRAIQWCAEGGSLYPKHLSRRLAADSIYIEPLHFAEEEKSKQVFCETLDIFTRALEPDLTAKQTALST